jgi:hypothetical protein
MSFQKSRLGCQSRSNLPLRGSEQCRSNAASWAVKALPAQKPAACCQKNDAFTLQSLSAVALFRAMNSTNRNLHGARNGTLRH